ncbi:MAG: hypothetical protein KC983_00735 [Phycisphaerales bacterium]|nr:hypothetical protein [Phycisphaerales bacterium]
MSSPYDTPSTDHPDSVGIPDPVQVRICPWCGYDRTGRNFGDPCSECGHEPRELLDDDGPFDLRHVALLVIAARTITFLPAVALLLVVPAFLATTTSSAGFGGAVASVCLFSPVFLIIFGTVLVASIAATQILRGALMIGFMCALLAMAFIWISIARSMPSPLDAMFGVSILAASILNLLCMLQIWRIAERLGTLSWRNETMLAMLIAAIGLVATVVAVRFAFPGSVTPRTGWASRNMFWIFLVGLGAQYASLWYAMFRASRALKPLLDLADDLGLSTHPKMDH